VSTQKKDSFFGNSAAENLFYNWCPMQSKNSLAASRCRNC